MAKKKKDDFIERKIIIGMIVSSEYLSRVFMIYKDGLMESDEADLIAKWCIEFYRHYRRAPEKEIELIYESKAKRISDQNQKDFIEGILDTLSEEWEQTSQEFNIEYLYDKTVEYFKVRSYKLLSDNLRIAHTNYDADMGESMLNDYHKVQAYLDESIEPFLDEALIHRSFDREQIPIFKFPGTLGEEVNHQLVQGGFLGLMGPEKRGKTWWLMEFIMRASRAGVPSAFFQAGDMDDEDMTVRMHIRLAKRSNRAKYCNELFVPVLDCEKNQNDTCNLQQRTSICGLVQAGNKEQNSQAISVRGRGGKGKAPQHRDRNAPIADLLNENPKYEPCSECYSKDPIRFRGAVYWKVRAACNPLTAQEAIAQGKKLSRIWRTTPRVSSHSAGTLTVSGIETILDKWEQYGTIATPKLLVIDYADLLEWENSRLELRHKQNEIWKALRGLAQKRKCLVVTATQADAASYEKDTLRMSNYSEDKRKYGHVTAMWGLNQTDDERDKGIMRINQLVARNDYFNSSRCISVLQCLQIGQPLISSYLSK